MKILLMTSGAPKYSPFFTDEKTAPLGVASLMAVLKKEGHSIHFVDNYLEPSGILETDFVSREGFDWVGIYANTVCYQATLEMLGKLQKMRDEKQWRGRIMVGGPHASVALESIPDFVDHVVVGEGEISILKIVSGEGKERVVYGERIEDMDMLPFPAWEELVYRPYHWRNRWIEKYPVYTLNTSRGCPFHCNFCSVNAVWGRSYRFMSAERVLDDVQRLVRLYGLKVAYFREDHFTMNKRRTIEFCEGLLRRNTGIDWMCESRVDQFDDPQYLELMARAGCKALYIGVESGSPRMLEFMKKGETVEQFIKAFEVARRFGIKTYASFVVGLPTETEDDLRQTYELIDRMKPDFHFMNVYTGLPGSEVYDYVKQNDLHEYEDENGILYLKGHDQRVNRFHNANPFHKVPYPDHVKWRRVKARTRVAVQWRWERLKRVLRWTE